MIRSLTTCLFLAFSAQALAGALAQDQLGDYVETLNHLFQRDGQDVTVGPADASRRLTFGRFVEQGDGTARATLVRFDQISSLTRHFDITMRQTASGAFEFSFLLQGDAVPFTYELERLGAEHMRWKNGVLTPFRNEYTGGRFQIETASFDVFLAADGRTAYHMLDAKYFLTEAYVASCCSVLADAALGEVFLRDSATGLQLSFTAADLPGLVALGRSEAPISSTIEWSQLAP